MRALTLTTLVSLAALAGCQTEDTLRLDGMKPGAGDAIAANSVMQMVDPWPSGVENPHLRVPAVRKPAGQAAAAPADPAP